MIETKAGSFEPETRLLIDGELAGAASGATFSNVNPATEVMSYVGTGIDEGANLPGGQGGRHPRLTGPGEAE